MCRSDPVVFIEPLDPEPLGHELDAEWLEAEWLAAERLCILVAQW